MKMLKRILLILILVITGIAAAAATRPDDFTVTRSATMNAAPEAIFARVNDFHNWDAWSPWARLDPNAKNEFGSSASGEGATFSWDGNHEVGAGTLTITESKPAEQIAMRLDFLRPFESTANSVFTFQPQEGRTLVTWTMTGKNNFIGKVISLFMDCDKMVGGQFEEGLANIKSIVEKGN